MSFRRQRVLELVADGLSVAFLRPTRQGRPHATWATVFALALVSVLLPSAFSFLSIGLRGELYTWMLPTALAHIPLILGAAIVAAYALDRRDDVAQLMAAGLLAAIVIDGTAEAAVAIAGPMAGRLRYTLSWLPVTWLILAMGTFACRKVQPGARRVAALAACVVLIAPADMALGDRTLWQESVEDRVEKTRSSPWGVATEDVFYKQPELLSQSLEAIRPGRKGVINVFLVAMAGYGYQDVFRREVDATTQLMTEQFAAEGHSIRLVNNTSTLGEMPIASKTSLRAALHRIASVMDKGEDILVLFMTSHGSAKTGFSLELSPMRFDDLDPATLRALLDESGIVNRVIIVSACYSGTYVKPLQDPNTLVVTAAAADRTSFGCSNEAQWTYFDKAYVDEGLRQTHSFTKAFEMAKPLIAERESKAGADASYPQISVGAAIAPRLKALEAQLDAAGGK